MTESGAVGDCVEAWSISFLYSPMSPFTFNAEHVKLVIVGVEKARLAVENRFCGLASGVVWELEGREVWHLVLCGSWREERFGIWCCVGVGGNGGVASGVVWKLEGREVWHLVLCGSWREGRCGIWCCVGVGGKGGVASGVVWELEGREVWHLVLCGSWRERRCGLKCQT